VSSAAPGEKGVQFCSSEAKLTTKAVCWKLAPLDALVDRLDARQPQVLRSLGGGHPGRWRAAWWLLGHSLGATTGAATLESMLSFRFFDHGAASTGCAVHGGGCPVRSGAV